jgi:PHD/YefM family antitoxin component YafN of YafNO toxin-antitoxin module
MATTIDVQIVSDQAGNPVSVIVPIELWREIESERETAYLLKSDAMKRRLLEAKERTAGISLEEARAKLGI